MKPIEQYNKHRFSFIVTAIMATLGFVTMAAIMLFEPGLGQGYGALASATFGAGFGGWLLRYGFGHPSAKGVAFSILAAIAATAIGAALAGLAFFGIFGGSAVIDVFDLAVAGAISSAIVLAILATTPIGIGWAVAIIALHFIAAKLRKQSALPSDVAQRFA